VRNFGGDYGITHGGREARRRAMADVTDLRNLAINPTVLKDTEDYDPDIISPEIQRGAWEFEVRARRAEIKAGIDPEESTIPKTLCLSLGGVYSREADKRSGLQSLTARDGRAENQSMERIQDKVNIRRRRLGL
jgi:hypothetical protein